MVTYNPKSLFNLAEDSFSKIIVTKCREIEKRFLTYDHGGCVPLLKSLHDELFALPPTMSGSVCEAALAYNDQVNYNSRVRDRRILYSVLLNEHVTFLLIRRKQSDEPLVALSHVIKPHIKNIVQLNIGPAECEADELVLAISATCKQLEEIILSEKTSQEAFRQLVDSCPKLQVIKPYCRVHPQNQGVENVIHALKTLPHLEQIEYPGVIEALLSLRNDGPFNLRIIHDKNKPEHEEDSRLAASLCPNLKKVVFYHSNMLVDLHTTMIHRARDIFVMRRLRVGRALRIP